MRIIDHHSLLSAAQHNLLKTCASQSFELEDFSSLDDILTRLKVDVYIEPGIPTRLGHPYLDEAEKYWRDILERIKDKHSKEYKEVSEIIDTIGREKQFWPSMRLRGLYDPAKNIIQLFPQEMQQEYDGKCVDELLVSTLAHETMHAYFNRPKHNKYPYILFVEEPLAEFGMLLYLYDTESPYYNWAYDDVSSKKTCYKYGAELMNRHLDEIKNKVILLHNRRRLESYRSGTYHKYEVSVRRALRSPRSFIVFADYGSMCACARAAIELYMTMHPLVTLARLQEKFNKGISYITEKPYSRAKKLSLQTVKKEDVYVYVNFRKNGSQTNWSHFVNVCRANGIIII